MSNTLNPEVVAVLRPDPAGTTLLITVGNVWRRDDGVGPYLASRLGDLAGSCRLLDAADRPENIFDEAAAAAPGKIVILDAADFGGAPGEIRVLAPAEIPEKGLSTHTFPIKLLARLLSQDTGATVHFVGLQPQNVSLGEGLSEPVRLAADTLVAHLRKEFGHA
jgi:hydrogenase 3 maturation protease